MNNRIVKINNYMSYLPATEGARHIVISHFHTDHAANIQKLVEEKNLRLTSVSLEDKKT